MTTQQIEQSLLVLPSNERLRLARLLLDSVLSESAAEPDNGHLDNAATLDVQFQREVEAFERLLPTLRAQHDGSYVAIHQGDVIAHGQDKLELLRHVRQTHGQIVCYIEKVAADVPRKARITSNWVAAG